MKMKYVIFRVHTCYDGTKEVPVLFPMHINHDTVRPGYQFKPISAGFFNIILDPAYPPTVKCVGFSETLRLGPRPDNVDEMVIQKFLFPLEYPE